MCGTYARLQSQEFRLFLVDIRNISRHIQMRCAFRSDNAAAAAYYHYMAINSKIVELCNDAGSPPTSPLPTRPNLYSSRLVSQTHTHIHPYALSHTQTVPGNVNNQPNTMNGNWLLININTAQFIFFMLRAARWRRDSKFEYMAYSQCVLCFIFCGPLHSIFLLASFLVVDLCAVD